MSDQTKYTNKLRGSRVLIIGGSSGIGYATAECLLEHDAHVIISSSNPQKVSDKVQALKSAYPSKPTSISGIACNLADRATLETNIKSLLDEATNHGQHKLDHIVHTAGDSFSIQPVQDADVDTVIQNGMVRFFGVIMLCKYAPKYMNPGPASSIVITTGSSARRPPPGYGALVGYGAGIEGVCRGMARDLAPIRVVAVSPGPVETELWDNRGFGEEQRAHLANMLLTEKVGEPSDAAEAYVYAMKDHNVTGVTVSTDGGQLLK